MFPTEQGAFSQHLFAFQVAVLAATENSSSGDTNTLCEATVITTKKKNTFDQAGKQLSLHNDKFRYDEREMDATKKLT